MLDCCHEAVEPCKVGTSGRPELAVANAKLIAEQVLSQAVDAPYPSAPVDEYCRASCSFECADFVFRAVSANLIGKVHNSGHSAANLAHQLDSFGSKGLRAPEKRHAPVAALRGKNSSGPLIAIS